MWRQSLNQVIRNPLFVGFTKDPPILSHTKIMLAGSRFLFQKLVFICNFTSSFINTIPMRKKPFLEVSIVFPVFIIHALDDWTECSLSLAMVATSAKSCDTLFLSNFNWGLYPPLSVCIDPEFWYFSSHSLGSGFMLFYLIC